MTNKGQEVGFCLSIHAEELRPFFFINIILLLCPLSLKSIILAQTFPYLNKNSTYVLGWLRGESQNKSGFRGCFKGFLKIS